MPLSDFKRESFSHEGKRREVLCLGDGPGVVIVHEVPGITPEVAAFARRVVARGFRVYLPHLFGVVGRPATTGYIAGGLLRACVSREFHVLASHGSSPVTEWLRALCRHAHAECGGPGVGAIGMCLTGNFALAMMVDESVMAPVLSQPSLPFPIGAERRAAIHLSPGDLDTVRARAARGCGVLGLRFTNDRSVPPERFETLRRELGDGFEGVEIDSSPGNPHGIPQDAHSVLTVELVDEEEHPTRQALDRVLALLEERLRPPATGGTS